MIVSDRHRYVFIELPRTGSSAISRELRQSYDGRPFLRKHSTYREFLAAARPEQRGYFAFSCIRNPLDDAVSRYFKYRTDHRAHFSQKGHPGRRGLVGLRDRLIWRWMQRREMDFPAFFRSVYVVPYDNWASESHGSLDLVIRFEHLEADFAAALARLGIEPIRPLPVRNVTGGRRRDFAAYYTPETIGRAKWVFGPFMRRWGYGFPSEWGEARLSRWAEAQFRVLGVLRAFYWRHLRFRI